MLSSGLIIVAGLSYMFWGKRAHYKAESVKQANPTLLEALITAEAITVFQEWEKQRSKNLMFKAKMNYLHPVSNPVLCRCNPECWPGALSPSRRAAEQTLFHLWPDQIKATLAQTHHRHAWSKDQSPWNPGKSCKQALTFPLHPSGRTMHVSIWTNWWKVILDSSASRTVSMLRKDSSW